MTISSHPFAEMKQKERPHRTISDNHIVAGVDSEEKRADLPVTGEERDTSSGEEQGQHKTKAQISRTRTQTPASTPGLLTVADEITEEEAETPKAHPTP